MICGARNNKTKLYFLSCQVQGVQSLQGLQLPQGQGQAQQLTLAPVQTLPLGQAGQVSLPNLQTVTVNSVTQAGIQYTQGEDTSSPVGTEPASISLTFTCVILWILIPVFSSWCFRHTHKRRARL